MRGKYNIRIQNSKVCFDLEIRRSITVIKGKSGTGKTTLLTMLREWKALGRKSGIACISNCEFTVFDHLTHWSYELENRHNTVIFVDEGIDYIFSDAFAHELIHSGNYLVCVTRSSYLRVFPYAISEIYEFKTLKENGSNITKMYQKYFDMNELSKQDISSSNV